MMKKLWFTFGLGVLTLFSCTTENSTEVSEEKTDKIILSNGEVIEIAAGDVLYVNGDTLKVLENKDGTLYILETVRVTPVQDPAIGVGPAEFEEVEMK